MPCKVCQKPTQREATGAGYKEYCSTKCMQTWRWANGKRDKTKSPFKDPANRKKSRETNIKRYGVPYHMQNKEHAQTWKEEYKEKTGYETALSNPEVRKKINTTVKEKYGVDHITEAPEVRAKIKKSMDTQGIKWGLTAEQKQVIIDYRRAHNVSDAVVADAVGVANRANTSRVLRGAGIEPGETSKPEAAMGEFIRNIFPTAYITHRNRQVIAPLEIDIYLPELKLGIEVNGVWWHKDRPTYHYDKYIAAKKAGITLLQVWDTEMDEHHLRILKSMLTCRYSQNATRIAARECQIRELSGKEANVFFSTNHWKGFLPSNKYYGLIHSTEIVCALAYSDSRFKDGTEITRCCSKMNTVVMGGFKRLLKHVEDQVGKTLISYSDNRLFSGKSFADAGFTAQKDSPIGYFWTDNNSNILSRYQTQKHNLASVLQDFNPEKSEQENMTANGYWKVYDAGQTVWAKRLEQNINAPNRHDKEHDIIEYRKTHDVTNKEIAEIFGTSQMTVGRIVKRAGMVPGANGTLTAVQTAAIINSKNSHTQESDAAIARRLGLRPGQVSTILRAEGIKSAWDISEKEKVDIIEYRKNNNSTDAEIAGVFKRSPDSITKILRAQDIGSGSTSVPESFMRRFIQHIFPNTEILYNTRKVIAPLEIDIYVPSVKLGIEVNGLYWHKERETYHYDKFKAAKEAGVDLIQVWDTELNLRHLRILKSMLTCRYLKTAKTIAARKCGLQEVNARVVEKFYRHNHWKGFLPSQHHLVLLDGDEVVSALSYSKARFGDGMEVTRCCSKMNTVVMGSVQRLLKAAETGREMISYSDNRLFSGRSFEQAGFIKQDRAPIGYFWFNSDGNILSRYMTQKHKLAQLLGDKFDATLSESDNMENAGYWKVYDAGQTIWKKPATEMFAPNLLKEHV